MLTFQLIVIPLLALAAIAEIRTLCVGTPNRRFHLFRLLVWLLAGVAVGFPEITSYIASLVGITRGADLVTYVFILFTVGALFRLYTGLFELQKKIAHLSRLSALKTAEFGPPERAAENHAAESNDRVGT